jgi:hypothetical protein
MYQPVSPLKPEHFSVETTVTNPQQFAFHLKFEASNHLVAYCDWIRTSADGENDLIITISEESSADIVLKSANGWSIQWVAVSCDPVCICATSDQINSASGQSSIKLIFKELIREYESPLAQQTVPTFSARPIQIASVVLKQQAKQGPLP